MRSRRDRFRGPLSLRDGAPRRIPVAESPQRLAAGAHSLLTIRASVCDAVGDADVLSRRSLATVRSDFQLHGRLKGTAPADFRFRLGYNDARTRAGLPV